jgi:hypothetical protein
MFPVRYELNSYIIFRRNSVFKGLIRYIEEINNADLVYFTEKAIPNTRNMRYRNLKAKPETGQVKKEVSQDKMGQCGKYVKSLKTRLTSNSKNLP